MNEPCCAPVLSAPLDAEAAEDLARVFAALADPVRLRILSLVAEAGEVCSCNLLEPLGKSQPTVSHHTKVLADAGLIQGEKRGRWVWWSVVPERLDAISAAVRPTAAVR
jgi:ArsR family transcriptional regulator, arsenate/arsenite/antimonite-responsive transcriptional repressor